MRDDSFLIEPVDTFWFGSGVPVLGGSADSNTSVFPPSPWTLQGFVRSRLLFAASGEAGVESLGGAEIRKLVGDSTHFPPGWRLRGPLVSRVKEDAAGIDRLEPWVKVPGWLRRRPGSGHNESPARGWPIPPDAPQIKGTRGSGGAVLAPLHMQALRGWTTLTNLRWALTGLGVWRWDEHDEDELPPFVSPEPRVGIEIDPISKTAADRMLYVGVQHRFEIGAGIRGRLEWKRPSRVPENALVSGAAPLGRKGRLARLTSAPPLSPELVALLDHENLQGDAELPDPVWLWVVLLTPAFLDGTREHPFRTADSTGGSVTVKATLLESGVLGGFDRARGGPRPMETIALPGSAWLFELRGEARRATALTLAGDEPADERERMGFAERVAGYFDANGGPLAVQRSD